MNIQRKKQQLFSTKTIILGMLVIVWMAVIFALSAQPVTESRALSSGIAQKGVEAIERVLPQARIDLPTLEHVLRKGAHFSAYFILGLLVIATLHSAGVPGRKAFLIAMLICISYAISDEIHQYFVPGRGPQLSDVLLDSTGSGIAMGVRWMVRRVRAR